jgi:hypothetical protein
MSLSCRTITGREEYPMSSVPPVGNVRTMCKLLGLNSEKELEQVLNQPHDQVALEEMQAPDQYWREVEEDAQSQEAGQNSRNPHR